jgi:hypothetical protein
MGRDLAKGRVTLEALWPVAPDDATNGQTARALGITSQQTIYVTTQELAGRRLIRCLSDEGHLL